MPSGTIETTPMRLRPPAVDHQPTLGAPTGPPDLRLARIRTRHPGHTTDWSSEYAYSPKAPPSRPMPLILLPPNGALWLRCVVLMPTLPARIHLLARKARFVSLLK